MRTVAFNELCVNYLQCWHRGDLLCVCLDVESGKTPALGLIYAGVCRSSRGCLAQLVERRPYKA